MQRFSSHPRRWTAIAGIGVVTFGTITTTATSAAAEEVIAGNPTCAQLGYGHEIKVEDPSGSFTLDAHGLVLTMTVSTHPDVADPNPDNAVTTVAVDGSSRVTTGTIVVKGGPAATVYSLDDHPPLHSPMRGNGKWPTISHVTMCFDAPAEPEAEPDGVLRLTKRVRGAGAPADATFVVCVEPVADTPGDRVCADAPIGDGEVAEFVLPPGEYRAVEPHLGSSWTMIVEPETVSVAPGDTVDVEMTNLFERPPPRRGSVIVTKVVLGDPPDATYELCVVGPLPAADASCGTVDGDGELRFDDLAPGSYTVREIDPGDGYTVTVEPETVVVLGGAVADATVTNEYLRRQSSPPSPPVPTPGSVPVTTPGVTPGTTPGVVPDRSPEPGTTPGVVPDRSPESGATPTPSPGSPTPAPQRLPETGADGRLVGTAIIVSLAGLMLVAGSRRRYG